MTPRTPVETSGKSRAPRRPQLHLPFMPPPELDYAEGFRKLAKIHVRAQREGLTKELALQRAHIMFSVGNPLGAAFDCERVLRFDAHCGEAHFLKGQALLAMAGLKHGIVSPGPGAYSPAKMLPSRRDLLWGAYCCFEKAILCNHKDGQARKARAATITMMQLLATGQPAVEEAP